MNIGLIYPTSRHDYGPYGNPLTSNGSTILNGKAYINERFDAETGLQRKALDNLFLLGSYVPVMF